MNSFFISTELLSSLRDTGRSSYRDEAEPDDSRDQRQQEKRPTPLEEMFRNQNPMKPGFMTMRANDQGGTDFNCTIGYCVESSKDYMLLLHVFYTATEKDNIILNIFSYGGQVNTGCDIITGMTATKANVITRAYGICASIAAVIWCCGKQREVCEDATIMFHMPSGGCWGKVSDNLEESKDVQEFFSYVLKTVAKNILSDEDLDNVINCRNDIFIPAKVINERLGNTQGGA